MTKVLTCAQCDATSVDSTKVFRQLQLAKSPYHVQACSEECHEALTTHMWMAYEECTACKGKGGVFPVLGDHPCRTCKGKGLVPRG